LTATFIPTLSYLARAQANATFSGHYRHASLLSNATTSPSPSNDTTTPPYTNSTTVPLLNSSLTISVDPTSPGLNLTSWLSNGTDMSLLSVALSGNVSSAYFSQLKPSVRLYPTGLEEKLPSGGKRVAFKAVFEDLSPGDTPPGSFVTDCASWVGVTGVVYGSMPVDLFVFEFGAGGEVEAVVNEGLRVRLEKVD
jgi:hypothetical protein